MNVNTKYTGSINSASRFMRQEFLERVHATHELLRAQVRFVQDFILEQASGPGKFNFVTIVRMGSRGAGAPGSSGSR